MNLILEISVFSVALVLGSVGGWFVRHRILQRQFSQMRQRSDELQALQMNLQHELNSQRNKNLEFETEKQKLVKKIESLTGQITESESTNPRVQSIQTQLTESQSRCEELDARLREADVKAETTVKTIQMLQRQYKESRELNEQLTAQIKAFESRTDDSGDYVNLMQTQLNEARSSNQQLSQQVTAFETNHQQFTQRLARQQTELDNLKSELTRGRQNAQTAQQELNKLRQNLIDAQSAQRVAEEAYADSVRDAEELRAALEANAQSMAAARSQSDRRESYEDNEESVHYSSISDAFMPPSSAAGSQAALEKSSSNSQQGKTPSTSPIPKRERNAESRAKGQRTEKFEPRAPREDLPKKMRDDLKSTGIRKLEALAEEIRNPKQKKDR